MILKAGTYVFVDTPSRYHTDEEGQDQSISVNMPWTSTQIIDGNSVHIKSDGFKLEQSIYTSGGSEGTVYKMELCGINVVFTLGEETMNAGDYCFYDTHWNGDPYWILETPLSFTTSNDVDVDDIVGSWYIANTNYNEVNAKPLAEITYNGETIAQLNAGETATLSCEGMKMASDVVVKVGMVITPTGSITFIKNGTYDVTNVAKAIVDVPILPIYEGGKIIWQN